MQMHVTVQSLCTLCMWLVTTGYRIVVLSAACRFDHILLETTGLADPAPIVAMLWMDEALEASIRLDAVITVRLRVSAVSNRS